VSDLWISYHDLESTKSYAPPDKVGPYRRELERHLTDMVRNTRSKGGIDLCLPVLPVYGAPMAASFVVADISEALRSAAWVLPLIGLMLPATFVGDCIFGHPVGGAPLVVTPAY